MGKPTDPCRKRWPLTPIQCFVLQDLHTGSRYISSCSEGHPPQFTIDIWKLLSSHSDDTGEHSGRPGVPNLYTSNSVASKL